MNMLSEEERERYLCNLAVHGLGEAGQERIKNSRVLVVGLGGLGSPAAYYLAAAGVGTLGLLDSGTLEVSNLQRQILHTTDRLGSSKTESARRTLAALNPLVTIRTHDEALAPSNAHSLFQEYDLVVECLDTFETQYLVNDVCLDLEKPFVTAGAVGLSGQVLLVVPGQSPCLRCAVPDIPECVPNNIDAGILGATAGVIGCIEAMEAIRRLSGLWRPRPGGTGLLHRLDGATMTFATLYIKRRPECRCAKIWSD